MGNMLAHKTSGEDRNLDLYLKEIAKTPLLTANEEQSLARRIKQGDQDALERLTKANLRFVVSVAKQYQNLGMPLSDLINEGNIGLMKAAKRFDETRGFKFISYAVWWIRQAILQGLAEQSRVVRLPLNRIGQMHKIGKTKASLTQELGYEPTDADIAKALEGMSFEEVTEAQILSQSSRSLDVPVNDDGDVTMLDNLEDNRQPLADDRLADLSFRNQLEALIDRLPPREAEIVKLFFAWDGGTQPTLEEIGIRFGLTRERIRQIKEKAVRSLRSKLNRLEADDHRRLECYMAGMRIRPNFAGLQKNGNGSAKGKTDLAEVESTLPIVRRRKRRRHLKVELDLQPAISEQAETDDLSAPVQELEPVQDLTIGLQQMENHASPRIQALYRKIMELRPLIELLNLERRQALCAFYRLPYGNHSSRQHDFRTLSELKEAAIVELAGLSGRQHHHLKELLQQNRQYHL